MAMAPSARHTPPLLLFLLVLVTARGAEAQSSSNGTNAGGYLGQTNFNPSMSIVIVVLISAFFFLGFFSIYVRQCAGDRLGAGGANSVRGGGGGGGGARQRGLDPAVLGTFPTLLYAEVKEHKIGKGALECAVCLSEFEDDETLRLLPKCSHVFHPDCIGAWLASHVTCPVCRCNLVPDPKSPSDPADTLPATSESPVPPRPDAPPAPAPAPAPEHAVAIDVDKLESEEERRRRDELEELERIGSVRRAARSSRRPARLPRSHSTGHSLAAVRTGDDLDRFTLRLPDHVRREIIAAGKLKRSTSLAAFPTAGEGSSRRGYGYSYGNGNGNRGGAAGEGSSRGGRSVRLGRSDRWPSFLARTLSAKLPAWARRGDAGEGSFKRWDAEGSGSGSTTRGKLAAVKAPFDCLGAAAPGPRDGAESIAPLRV